MITGMNITLIVGGSVASYRSVELTRELVRKGARVHVVMTEAAREYITPLTFQSLSGNQVTASLFDELKENRLSHVWLADHANLVVVAPATADLMAKAACGIADDVATTVLLGAKAPVIFAPAMTGPMWASAVTQRNVATLRELGMMVIDPREEELVSGWLGAGRFTGTEDVLHALQLVTTPKDLSGSRIIVTAGPTREALDPIRFISNRSTGKMGYAIAQVAQWRGAQVTLISGPTALVPPRGVQLEEVSSAQEMYDQVVKLVRDPGGERADGESGRAAQLVFMASSVCDHRPASVSKTKFKQHNKQNYSLTLVPTADILQELGDNRTAIEEETKRRMLLVGFTTESGDEDELLTWAREKLERKDGDLMVGNYADEIYGRDTNRVWLLDRTGRQEEIAAPDRLVLASKIISAALRL